MGDCAARIGGCRGRDRPKGAGETFVASPKMIRERKQEVVCRLGKSVSAGYQAADL